ncbi:MAG: hypothetical protein ACYC0B_01945 [Gemmatimonadaceae bacterium]
MTEAAAVAGPSTFWLWWLVINLAFGCYAMLKEVPELEPHSAAPAARVALRVGILAICALLGVLVYGALLVVRALEEGLGLGDEPEPDAAGAFVDPLEDRVLTQLRRSQADEVHVS